MGASYREAGWITAAFFGAYILAVPFLVTLTDQLGPKLVYLSGVALTVVGHLLLGHFADGCWSAFLKKKKKKKKKKFTYMTGLKLLADRFDAKLLSRATGGMRQASASQARSRSPARISSQISLAGKRRSSVCPRPRRSHE